DYLGTLRHLDRLLPRDAALIVLAVRDQNHCAPGCHRALLLHLQHLVAARKVERIVKRRPASRTQLVHPRGKLVDVAGESLRDLRGGVKSCYEGQIFVLTNNARKELDRRLLLEGKTTLHRAAYIDQQTNPQR